LSTLPLALTSEILTIDPTADAYSQEKILHGLCRDTNGKLTLKPEIERRLQPRRRGHVTELLWSNRESEANSLAACRLINKVLEECPDGHEAVKVPIWCGKPFLCGDCATPGSRVHKFHYEHPYLYELMMNSAITILKFMIDPSPDGRGISCSQARINLEKAQEKFELFIRNFDDKDHGWYFAAGFSYDEDSPTFSRTKFYAIHIGPKLPGYPELAKLWRAAAGPQARVTAKLFDGKDGDGQYDGLKLAFSGFVDYHEGLRDMDGWPAIDYSEAFAKYNTCKPYGYFYGYGAREERRRKAQQPEPPPIVDLCVEGHEHEHKTKCGKCGKDMVPNNRLPLMTDEELDQRYERVILGHSSKAIYGRVGTTTYGELGSSSTPATVSPPS